ncbi:MAG: glutathione S-transferase [Burkholderiales bacterium]|nr:glutathione S-transferase [Burkholderiales bacterium]MBL6736176.1 glutathione S-transferase [Burkholderiales bacterium]MBL6879063.1 glutathione S-transferase [Burkholderiales bacterium]OUT80037.1 MAG: glutathione S-transferase [Betaproteobacteria bacterium TMED22]|tara:strand:+ start:415 stop:1203 length:789 start_codon:yes stop_codon:yes gene_type:complete
MELRIFSYLPNPRIWKATIAARLCGINVEVVGAPHTELSQWLWDFEAHLMTEKERVDHRSFGRQSRLGFGGDLLYKTDSFLNANPFGTVPTAFNPDGSVGIFESNSIMRTVARLGTGACSLYGDDAYSASRIDGFLDASLVFARDSQLYLLSLLSGNVTSNLHGAAYQALHTYLDGLNRALSPDRTYLVGDTLSIADICVVAELALFLRERDYEKVLSEADLERITGPVLYESYPLITDHFRKLCEHEAFAPDVNSYVKKYW